MSCACTPGSLAGDHFWLIILLFAADPAAFAALSVAFLRAFHLVLAGIALRGAAFVSGPRGPTSEVLLAPGVACSRSRVRCPGAPGDHPWCERDRDCAWWTGWCRRLPAYLGRSRSR